MICEVDWDHPDAVVLREARRADIAEAYGRRDSRTALPPSPTRPYLDALACGEHGRTEPSVRRPRTNGASEGQAGNEDRAMIADAGFVIEGATEQTLPDARHELVTIRRRGAGTDQRASA